MDSKIQRLREKLAKQRSKIAEMEAQAAETEKEIRKAEEEQLGYLARSAALKLSGGMDELLDILRGMKANPGNAANTENPRSATNTDEIKEGETVYEPDETGDTEQTEI